MTAFLCTILFIPVYLEDVGAGIDKIIIILTIAGALDVIAPFVHGWIVSIDRVNAAVYNGVTSIFAGGCICIMVTMLSASSSVVMVPFCIVLLGPVDSVFPVVILQCVGSVMYPATTPFTDLPSSVVLVAITVLFGGY